MANTEKPNVTTEEIAHAHNLWAGFTKLLKYGTIITIASLILLGLLTL